MKVQLGFSGEVATNQWRKGDIELDELDLKRILDERADGYDPAKLNTIQAYRLLEAETTRLLYEEMLRMGAANKQEVVAQITDANARIEKILAGLS